jgi:hypothetical protein
MTDWLVPYVNLSATWCDRRAAKRAVCPRDEQRPKTCGTRPADHPQSLWISLWANTRKARCKARISPASNTLTNFHAKTNPLILLNIAQGILSSNQHNPPCH